MKATRVLNFVTQKQLTSKQRLQVAQILNNLERVPRQIDKNTSQIEDSRKIYLRKNGELCYYPRLYSLLKIHTISQDTTAHIKCLTEELGIDFSYLFFRETKTNESPLNILPHRDLFQSLSIVTGDCTVHNITIENKEFLIRPFQVTIFDPRKTHSLFYPANSSKVALMFLKLPPIAPF